MPLLIALSFVRRQLQPSSRSSPACSYGADLRCEALNTRIDECLGEGFGPIECEGVTNTDLETMIGTPQGRRLRGPGRHDSRTMATPAR